MLVMRFLTNRKVKKTPSLSLNQTFWWKLKKTWTREKDEKIFFSLSNVFQKHFPSKACVQKIFLIFFEKWIYESRKSENINKVGKYDKKGGNRGKSDLKNLKIRSYVSNEILD